MKTSRPLSRGVAAVSDSEATTSPAPVNGAPVKTRPAKPRNLAAMCVVAPEPRTGSQALILSYVHQSPLVLTRPDPYLLELHERFTALASPFGDVATLDVLLDLAGVVLPLKESHVTPAGAIVAAIGKLSDYIADSIQLLEAMDSSHHPYVNELDTIHERLTAALEILKHGAGVATAGDSNADRTAAGPAAGMHASADPDSLGAIARRRDAESRAGGAK